MLLRDWPPDLILLDLRMGDMLETIGGSPRRDRSPQGHGGAAKWLVRRVPAASGGPSRWGSCVRCGAGSPIPRCARSDRELGGRTIKSAFQDRPFIISTPRQAPVLRQAQVLR